MEGAHPDDTIIAQNENAALLLLLAGSAGDTDAEVDSDCDSDGPRDDEWESVVTAGDDLLSKLRLEVVGTTRSSLTRHEAIMIRCPLCPFRCMSRWSHWATHLFKYHTETQQFCCSGTKQLRIAIALFDSDRARGIDGDDYLKRSAALLRQDVSAPIDSSNDEVDRWVRLVFTESGPKYCHLKSVESDGALRIVGNIYYSRCFANMVYKELLLHDSKVSDAGMRC